MKIATTAPGALKILWKNKFFFKQKTIIEIKTNLEKEGYNFKDSNLANALKRAKILTRKGSKGNYSYVQKYPYFEETRKKK